jgi:hypothetical protein
LAATAAGLVDGAEAVLKPALANMKEALVIEPEHVLADDGVVLSRAPSEGRGADIAGLGREAIGRDVTVGPVVSDVVCVAAIYTDLVYDDVGVGLCASEASQQECCHGGFRCEVLDLHVDSFPLFMVHLER